MSDYSFLKIGNGCFYLDSTTLTYFGIQKGYLDIHTMRYNIFGAVWKIANGRKYILGYWFAEHENDIKRAIQAAGFSDAIKSEQNEIDEIYHSIRGEQEQKDWSKRKMLNVLSFMKKPWKDLKEGWYVLNSSTNFPMILTCIQKKRYSVWIEHIRVCETEVDIKKFLNLINLEHNINLTAPETMMSFPETHCSVKFKERKYI
jgi:hypothetical protein